MILVVPCLCEGSLANPGNRSSWSTYCHVPREDREGSQQEERGTGQLLAEVLPFSGRVCCESRVWAL